MMIRFVEGTIWQAFSMSRFVRPSNAQPGTDAGLIAVGGCAVDFRTIFGCKKFMQNKSCAHFRFPDFRPC